MAVANKLAVLQNIKQEKCVVLGSLSNDFTKQKKYEKWKEVNELAESLGLAMTVLLDSVWQGRLQNFRGLRLIQFWGSSLRKRIQNNEYKIKHETE
jgi:hypothetical protein